ncbi:metal ABC transporter ATP-binding protein [Candidatus Dependentiae bacterium]|nr:MAG: metal ABC transporter ATP-binding protein [Candidatus Dependentiae bacterium]
MSRTDTKTAQNNSSQKPAIQVSNLTVYRKNDCVLHDIHFTINQGSIVGIIGPNGAGKSTLLNTLISLHPHQTGAIVINKSSPYCIAYVPQRASIDWDFPVTVYEVVMMGRYPYIPFYKRPSKKDHALVAYALEQVNMTHVQHKPIGELSGGQQQRVFFARALAQQASIYFLDEPFTGIDAPTENDLIHILRNEKKEGKTVVMVHHDLTTAQAYFDTILVLNKKLLYYGTPKNIENNYAITKAYGRQVLTCQYNI